MEKETRVGFDLEDESEKVNLATIIPFSITQYYMLMPL